MSAMVAAPSMAAVIVAPAVVMAVPVVARATVVVRESQAERHRRIDVGRPGVGIGAVIGGGRIAGVAIGGHVGAIVGRIRSGTLVPSQVSDATYAGKEAHHHMTHLCRENQATEIKDIGCAWHTVSNELAYETRPATIALAARTALPVASLAVTSDTAADICRREARKSRLSGTSTVNRTARGRKRTLSTFAHVFDSRSVGHAASETACQQ